MIGSSIATLLSGTRLLSGTSNPDPWLVDWVRGGVKTSSGETINESTALRCAAVYAAVRVLAETVAALPLDVYRRQADGGKQPIANDPLQRLLHDEPNEDTSAYIWRETLQGHLGTWGNAYAEIERAVDGTPVALWQRSPKPQHTKPMRREDVDGKIWFRCRDDAGREDWVRARNMLHVPGLGFDGLIGYSPISLMREPIGVGRAAERYAGELFQNDARPSGVITVEGEFSDEGYKRTKNAFNADGADHGSRHRVQLLERGATFASTQMNPQEVQMLEARKFGIEEIARAFRIAPTLLQDLTHGTYSNITELGRQFIVYTMMPWLKRWEAEMNRKLLPPGTFCKFDTRAFLRGDHKERALYYQKLFAVGAYTVNKILELEDENPIGPEGDVRFVPSNMITLETAIEGPPEPAPPTPPIPPTPPQEDENEAEEQRANQTAIIVAAVQQEGVRRSCDMFDHDARQSHLHTLGRKQVAAKIDEQLVDAQEKHDEQIAHSENHERSLGALGKDIARRLEGIDAAIEDLKAKEFNRAEALAAIAIQLKRLEGDQAAWKRLGRRAWEVATNGLLTKEANEAQRRAKQDGNFIQKMEGFYEGHRELCLKAFEVAGMALDYPAAWLTKNHIDQSWQALLEATECQREDLPESVAQCVATWADDRYLIEKEPEHGDTETED